METNSCEILIVGGGVFGISSAIELVKRKYQVTLINPDTIPHHLAASTDITKIVRMEYGTDTEYFKMAELAIERFHQWNELFNEEIYHQVGILMLCKEPLMSPAQAYEHSSYVQLKNAGYDIDNLSKNDIAKRFPAVNTENYYEANYNPIAGYVKSGRLVERLAQYAQSLGVIIKENQTAEELIIDHGRLLGVKTHEGNTYHCGHAVIAAGTSTPYLLPELKPYMKATGHPVFWLRPKDSELFSIPKLSVFTADISNSGWYGFPFTSQHGVIKVAKHTDGLELHPYYNDRRVTDVEVSDMRLFLRETLPALSDASLVYTRKCLYTDTLDGHFWIDHHPEIKGLSVSSGGSGHGLKMAPVIGEMTADMIEKKSNQFLERYRWRHLSPSTRQIEEARYIIDRKL